MPDPTTARPISRNLSPATTVEVQIYFSDIFEVAPADLEEYGAFNVSLINDLPLFIDPFLLFNSKKSDYQHLHEQMIRYLRFLRDKSASGQVTEGLLKAWFTFKEVKQNWLGFSRTGNGGSGLGLEFAAALNQNLNSVFAHFGEETITKGSHLEKLTLIGDGVGRDNISDFTTNLIKRYLLAYTQAFAQKYIRADLRKWCTADKVSFNYETESWQVERFELPSFENDFVILSPKDLLTKDETWISRSELLSNFDGIATALPDEALRDLINNHFRRQLPRSPKDQDIRAAKANTIQAFPILIEHYIRQKEDDGDRAESVSSQRVRQVESVFIDGIKEYLVRALFENTGFYTTVGNTREEARKRVMYLKDVIESKDGYRIFWPGGQPLRKEEDIQILYRLTWCGTVSDINREVNNGRGPADFKISRGTFDKSIVEFKLASNKQLKRNLQNQVEIYQKASDAARALKVITYFTAEELEKTERLLAELGLLQCHEIILIDARRDNKPSASKA